MSLKPSAIKFEASVLESGTETLIMSGLLQNVICSNPSTVTTMKMVVRGRKNKTAYYHANLTSMRTNHTVFLIQVNPPSRRFQSSMEQEYREEAFIPYGCI